MASTYEGIHVGDVGTRVLVTVLDRKTLLPLDLSSATVIEGLVVKPGGEKNYRTVVFDTDGSDGLVVYTSALKQDFDLAGDWGIRIRIVMPSWSGHSSKTSFHVYEVD